MLPIGISTYALAGAQEKTAAERKPDGKVLATHNGDYVPAAIASSTEHVSEHPTLPEPRSSQRPRGTFVNHTPRTFEVDSTKRIDISRTIALDNEPHAPCANSYEATVSVPSREMQPSPSTSLVPLSPTKSYVLFPSKALTEADHRPPIKEHQSQVPPSPASSQSFPEFHHGSLSTRSSNKSLSRSQGLVRTTAVRRPRKVESQRRHNRNHQTHFQIHGPEAPKIGRDATATPMPKDSVNAIGQQSNTYAIQQYYDLQRTSVEHSEASGYERSIESTNDDFASAASGQYSPWNENQDVSGPQGASYVTQTLSTESPTHRRVAPPIPPNEALTASTELSDFNYYLRNTGPPSLDDQQRKLKKKRSAFKLGMFKFGRKDGSTKDRSPSASEPRQDSHVRRAQTSRGAKHLEILIQDPPNIQPDTIEHLPNQASDLFTEEMFNPLGSATIERVISDSNAEVPSSPGQVGLRSLRRWPIEAKLIPIHDHPLSTRKEKTRDRKLRDLKKIKEKTNKEWV
ncbi:hypothetical protein CC78DRAFT_275845 [Lojkania enalia]|uniref:Uncharacterized protein n=1 Tax=Lojkania enalia TaxID=147567 RepID=A0A9P4K5X3_9PLEO|nr:hypothetical protein CC78DRAFT_275845 [Didymosphaeria enalia]